MANLDITPKGFEARSHCFRLEAGLGIDEITQRCDDDGLQAAQSAIDLDRQLGQLDHLAVPLIVLGQIHQCHGNAGMALRFYEEALELAEEIGEPQLLFPCYEGMATVFLDEGDDERADPHFIKADEVCAQAGVDRDSLVVLPFLCWPRAQTAGGRSATDQRPKLPAAAMICDGVGKMERLFGPSSASIWTHTTMPSASTRKCPAS